MKAIILAAGKGTRLMPLTKEVPKCMVDFNGKLLIDRILENLKHIGVSETAVISGYMDKKLRSHLGDSVKFYHNNNFSNSNMVTSLFIARDFINDDTIVSYSDIAYSSEVLKSLACAEGADLSVVVDKKWLSLWSLRMDDPLADAETLKIKDGRIREIGKKPNTLEDIEGQYMGLFKIHKNSISRIIDFYNNLKRNDIYDGKDFDNMYMTSFIQLLIDNGFTVKPVFIEGGWVEIDTISDLEAYKNKNINV